MHNDQLTTDQRSDRGHSVDDDRGPSRRGVRGAGRPYRRMPTIDGTGWVRGTVDGDRITATGQVFRMAMYHENHPDKDYEMANRVEVFDEPHAIAWQPGPRVA